MLAPNLQDNVLRELRYDPRIDASKIGVFASEVGVVTLTGDVPSYFQKQAAEQDAKRVFGVRAVANDVRVEAGAPVGRTDTDIAEAAVTTLKWRTAIPDNRIKVTVSNGWVTLEGDVDFHYQKRDAEEAVSALTGVVGVTNNIRIRPQEVRPATEEVREQIRDALVRSARLDARGIDVRTDDGRIILEGTVRSWTEADEAELAAWGAPGVTDVENRIEVIP